MSPTQGGNGRPGRTASPTYEVGYGRPPATSRFRSGESGNPRGRPKGTRNFRTDLEDELSAKIAITENGRPKTLSKQRMMVKVLVTKAIKGDARSIGLIVEHVAPQGGLENRDTNEVVLPPDDQVILADFIASVGPGAGQNQRTTSGEDNDLTN